MQDAVKAASGQEAGLGADKRRQRSSKADAACDAGSARRDMRSHPRGLDVLNDESLDDTVDADGKNRDAKRDMEMREREPDAVVTSNATRVNFVGRDRATGSAASTAVPPATASCSRWNAATG